MTRKTLMTCILTIASFLVLFGCSKKDSSSTNTTSDSDSRSLLITSFEEYNKEAIRELTIAESDGSNETTYTWNHELNAYLQTGTSTDQDGNTTSSASILSQEDGTDYEYYQTDSLLENGDINESAGYVRVQDTENAYKFCENTLTLELSESASIENAQEDSIDGRKCQKIEMKDPTLGTVTYWVDNETQLPLQMQSDTQITAYRTGESSCMTFEIPTNFKEKDS